MTEIREAIESGTFAQLKKSRLAASRRKPKDERS